MNQRIIYFLFIIFACSNNPLFCAETDQPLYSNNVNKGIISLKSLETDSALWYFWNASLQGMSKDSLYYFLAELYIVKETLDTALMLNYSIKADTRSGFKRALLQQRFLIYSGLGLSQRASETLDSLWDNRITTAKDFLPGIKINTLTGYNSDYELLSNRYPWHPVTVTPRNDTVADFDHALRITTSWVIPLRQKLGLLLAGKGTLKKPYLAESAFFDRDSIDFSGGCAVGLSGLFDRMQIEYEWERRKNYLNTLTSTNSISVLYSGYNDRLLYFVNVLYGMDIGGGWKINDQFASLLCGLSRNIGAKNRLGFNLVSTALMMDELVLNRNAYLLPVIDFRNAADTAAIPGAVLIKVNQSTIIDTVALNAEQVIPNSYIAVMPSVLFERDLMFDISAGITVQWSFNYYFKEYTWSDFKLDSTDIMTRVLTFKNSDPDEYYWVKETFALKDDIQGSLFNHFTYGPVERFSKKRIDNGLKVSLTFRRAFRWLGVFEIEGAAGKSWSTLYPDLPFSIQDWHWYMVMRWYKRFSWGT